MHELKILPEIRRRLPPPREEELVALENSLLKEGIRDPLVVWRRGDELVLVDGHIRYELAKKHNLPFSIVERNFNDLDEVLAWIDQHHLGRRNLTNEQRAFILGRIHKTTNLRRRKPPKERKTENLPLLFGDAVTTKAVETLDGVSKRTVRDAVKFANALEALEQISPKAAERILRGEVRDALQALPKVSVEALEFVAKQIENGERSIQRAKAKWYQQQKEQRLKRRAEESTELGRPFVLYCCDIRDAYKFVPSESVDLVVTDPPYDYEYFSLYEELSKFAAHALKDGGICLVMTGAARLPDILNSLTKHLNYIWTLSYVMPHSGPRAFFRNIAQSCKPIIYLAKGKPFIGMVNDTIISKSPEKWGHEWQQNLEAFTELIKRFARKGMVVCDPFCGSGTTGVAALLNGCKFIGIDIDPKAIEVAEKRLTDMLRGNGDTLKEDDGSLFK